MKLPPAAILRSVTARADKDKRIRLHESLGPPLSPNINRKLPLFPVILDNLGKGGLGIQKLRPWLLDWPFVDLECQHVVLTAMASNGAKHVMQFSCVPLR